MVLLLPLYYLPSQFSFSLNSRYLTQQKHLYIVMLKTDSGHKTNRLKIGEWNINSTSDTLTFLYRNHEQARLRFTFDYIVVGAGPSGCACARKLAQSGSTVALIERGTTSNSLANAGNAEVETLTSTDGYSIILGKGLGGGTNHNGMAFVDHKSTGPMLDTHFPSLTRYFPEINAVINPQELNSFDSSTKQTIETAFPNVIYNKHWSDTQPGSSEYRFTAAKFIENFDNIYIFYEDVDFVNFDSLVATGVTFKTGMKLTANNSVVLTAGAIHSPCILERSGLFFNSNTLRDHCAFNIFVPIAGNEAFCQHYFETTQTSLYQVWESSSQKYQIYFTPIKDVGCYITCSTSALINNSGTVSYNNSTQLPEITMNYTSGSENIELHLQDAFNLINNKFNLSGVTFAQSFASIDSIYHYSSSLVSSVTNYKVNGYSNLYVGDLSVLDGAPPCSTSVLASAIGMDCANTILSS
jgi:hypothetical protein